MIKCELPEKTSHKQIKDKKGESGIRFEDYRTHV